MIVKITVEHDDGDPRLGIAYMHHGLTGLGDEIAVLVSLIDFANSRLASLHGLMLTPRPNHRPDPYAADDDAERGGDWWPEPI